LEKEQNYIVYQVYGNTNFFNEFVFSFLSVIKHDKTIQFIIYTDNKSRIENLVPKTHKIHYQIINNETIANWKGKNNDNFRVKIKIIEHLLSNFSGNFIHLDTDTFVKKDLNLYFDSVAKNSFIFDELEDDIFKNSGGIAKKFVKFINKNKTFLTQENYTITKQFLIWNSGVLGFSSSLQKHIASVLTFNDALYEKGAPYIIEQASFSYYIPQHYNIITSQNDIHHYWYFKEFRTILEAFCKKDNGNISAELLKNWDKINPEKLGEEKRIYKKMNFWQRTHKKITTFRKWKIPEIR
jgi:hypothetical protein